MTKIRSPALQSVGMDLIADTDVDLNCDRDIWVRNAATYLLRIVDTSKLRLLSACASHFNRLHGSVYLLQLERRLR